MGDTYLIKGDWYDGDGYISDLADRSLVVDMADGKIYAADLPREFGPLTIHDDGSLHGWADAIFRPDEGELARIGAA